QTAGQIVPAPPDKPAAHLWRPEKVLVVRHERRIVIGPIEAHAPGLQFAFVSCPRAFAAPIFLRVKEHHQPDHTDQTNEEPPPEWVETVLRGVGFRWFGGQGWQL